MHSLLRGLAPLDSLSLDTVHQLTLGDELGRERSVRVWDEYGAWEMPDMWRFLAKVSLNSLLTYTRLQLLHLRSDPIRCRAPTRRGSAQIANPRVPSHAHVTLLSVASFRFASDTVFRTLLAWH